jgi:ribosomal protein L11 methyltransferase
MEWLVLEVERPAGEEAAAAAIEVLLALSGRGVEEREGVLIGYLPAPESSPLSLVEELRRALAEVLEGSVPSVRYRLQPHEAWEENWKQGFAPRRVTERIVVSPTWADPGLQPGELLLSLDPGMAFGTAQHATTRGSLRLLDSRVSGGERVADVGSGSGILAIAAALLGARRVIAFESDPWSCAAARENVERNRVAAVVEVREEAVGPTTLERFSPFDGIVANIESGILAPLLPSFRAALRPGAWLLLSGILGAEWDEMAMKSDRAGFSFEAVDREDEWVSAAFRARP